MPTPSLIDIVRETAAQGASIATLKEGLARIEQKVDGLRTWLISIMATALLACLMMIFKLLHAEAILPAARQVAPLPASDIHRLIEPIPAPRLF
jgi:hypothetical protein